MGRISRMLRRMVVFSALVLQPGCMLEPTGPVIERQPGGTKITDPEEPRPQRQSSIQSGETTDSTVPSVR